MHARDDMECVTGTGCPPHEAVPRSMEKEQLNDPIPWLVAELVCERVVRATPRSLFVLGDPDGRVVDTVERLLGDPEIQWPCEYWDGMVDELAAGTEMVVCLDAGRDDLERSWRRMQGLARHCTGTVVWAEPVGFRRGIGISRLRDYDPEARRIVCEEVPDGDGGTRAREAWEPRTQWVVAELAAWRLQEGAEAARQVFVAGLSQMSPDEIGIACDRMLERWPTAHEVLTLAIAATASHGARTQTRALLDRLRHCPGMSAGQLERELLVARSHGVAVWRSTSRAEERELAGARAAANHGPYDDT